MGCTTDSNASQRGDTPAPLSTDGSKNPIDAVPLGTRTNLNWAKFCCQTTDTCGVQLTSGVGKIRQPVRGRCPVSTFHLECHKPHLEELDHCGHLSRSPWHHPPTALHLLMHRLHLLHVGSEGRSIQPFSTSLNSMASSLNRVVCVCVCACVCA